MNISNPAAGGSAGLEVPSLILTCAGTGTKTAENMKPHGNGLNISL